MRKLNTFLTNQFVVELIVSLHAVRKADQHIADQDNGNYNLNNSIKTTWLAIPSEFYEEMYGFTSFLRKKHPDYNRVFFSFRVPTDLLPDTGYDSISP